MSWLLFSKDCGIRPCVGPVVRGRAQGRRRQAPPEGPGLARTRTPGRCSPGGSRGSGLAAAVWRSAVFGTVWRGMHPARCPPGGRRSERTATPIRRHPIERRGGCADHGRKTCGRIVDATPERPPATAARERERCDIKGNVSYNGDRRLYHLRGDRDYAKTRINPGRGERWFCSEAEARAAGWRRAGR